MLVQLAERSAQILLMHFDELILSHVLRAGPDDDVIHKGVGTVPALPFLAPIGTTFHCMNPSGVDIAVQGLESGCSGIW